LVGKDAGELIGQACGVRIVPDAAEGIAGADCLIDFTHPAGTLAHLEQCLAKGVRMVIGTTGLSASELARIRAAAEELPIVLAPNMSAGVNVAFKLAETAAARERSASAIRRRSGFTPFAAATSSASTP
jgi:4-hydroxy-tetrahydrodipicolinate reductase